MPTRSARAIWTGTIKDGSGTFQGESGVVHGNYSFNSRFQDAATGDQAAASNPEELLAAAQAGCYSMALSGNLERKGFPPTRIDTDAACSIVRDGDGFKIDKIALVVRAVVPGISHEDFIAVATMTKETCPVSKALAGNVELTLDAGLTAEAEVLLAGRPGGGSTFPNVRV